MEALQTVACEVGNVLSSGCASIGKGRPFAPFSACSYQAACMSLCA